MPFQHLLKWVLLSVLRCFYLSMQVCVINTLLRYFVRRYEHWKEFLNQRRKASYTGISIVIPQKVFILRNKSPRWPSVPHPSVNLGGGGSFLAVQQWRGVQKLWLLIFIFLPWGQPLRSVLLMFIPANVCRFSWHVTVIECCIPFFPTLSSPRRIGQLVWLLYQFACLFILCFTSFMLLFLFSSSYISCIFKWMNSGERQLVWNL